MKRQTLVAGLVLLGAVSFVGLDIHDAWARAGSGGSRGSRSYSAPVRPSPGMPAGPMSPARPVPAPAAQSPARPGWAGGLLGGLGGFMLGGLLGGLLFGGLGHGAGIGMLDILLIGGGALLLITWLRRRQPQPPAAAYAGMPGGRYAATPSWTPAGGGAATASVPVATADPGMSPAEADLARGLGHVRQMDGSFDPATVAAFARDAFARVQRAVGARDLGAVREILSPEMIAVLQRQCDELRGSRRVNHVDALDLRGATVSEAWQESGRDWVTVRVEGTLADYTVDESTGAVVDGSRSPKAFEEYWTFTRPVGPGAWKLSAIQAS
jgi:predicted lipid-binding transport protein (Tim44 family)